MRVCVRWMDGLFIQILMGIVNARESNKIVFDVDEKVGYGRKVILFLKDLF